VGKRMVKIQTGVDKLVELVDEKKKISLEQAARILGVSKVVVQEWADFLEEEGIISVEYKLSKVYLVERKLNKKEVEKKAKEYGTKRDTFVRKAESSLRSIEKNTAYFDNIKTEFEKVKKTIGSDINSVKNELEELKHYESLKNDIDKNIIKQKEEFQKTINNAYDQIKKEEQRYSEIMDEIGLEKNKITEEKEDFKKLFVEEETLKQKLDGLRGILQEIDKHLAEEKSTVNISEGKINKLTQLAQTIETNIKEKKEKTITPLMKLSQEHKEKILKVQDEILDKIKQKQLNMKDTEIQGEKVYAKFQSFFDKKANVDELFKKIDEDRNIMKKELAGLIKKAIAFNLTLKSADVKQQTVDLEKKLSEINNKRDVLKKEMEKLNELIKT